MSLIQIPKIEYITLDQFIPNWTEMIEEMDEKNITDRISYARDHDLSYSNPNQCLVGESWKFDSEGWKFIDSTPGCIKCIEFCRSPLKML